MPELPEVEHAARALRRWFSEGPIVRARAGATRIFRAGGRRLFERRLPGRRLERVDRRGKVLLLQLDGGVGLLSHLGMTGKWVRLPSTSEPPPHSHARLEIDGGTVLHYCDPRLFGRLEVHLGTDLGTLPAVASLGPDPLADGIDAGALHAALSRTARAVKVAIMDQTVLAGVGNIYATEALFRACIHPARPASSLSKREVARLAEGIEAAMSAALAMQGEEIAYLSEGGAVENRFLVYDRAGQACPRCRRGAIEKVAIGGRTSAFCGRCQRR
jgi:formamidopyrimidine-DNA glycosylase